MYQVPLEMICRHDRTAEVCRAAVEEDGWQLENVPEVEKPLNFDPFGHARFAHLFVLYD